MHPQKDKQPKPFASISRAVNQFLGRRSSEESYPNVNPVDELREGLKDIKAGRVREIKSVHDILKDE